VAPPPEYIWNHRIHQQWAKEDLSFWRLAFFPRYQRVSVLETLEELLQEEEVSSYAIYEALGLFDIFLRTWLPSQSMERFEKSLNEALQGEYLQLMESFTVTRVLRHHVWDSGDGLAEPPAEILQNRFSDPEIDEINRRAISEERRIDLETQKVIGELPEGEGVKFFTIITSPVYSTTFGAQTRLEKDLLQILDESGIEEPSLYAGSGFGRFVLMGRAPTEEFFEIPRLVTKINELGIYESFTARPYTHICAAEKVLVLTDRILTQEAVGEVDVAQLLRQPESRELEVKASVRLDFKAWLSAYREEPEEREDEAEEDALELVPRDVVANEGVIKAAVGMLNTNGGQILIGALERKRKFGQWRAEDHPLLADYPKDGDYVIVGVNEEERFLKKGIEGFRNQLQEILTSRIEPSPAGLISIFDYEFHGKTVCVLNIQPSTSTWFYRFLGPKEPVKFYVREDGRTVAYAGSEADNYKRAHSRA